MSPRVRISVTGATQAAARMKKRKGALEQGLATHMRLALAIVRQSWIEFLSGVPGSHPFWGRTGSPLPKLGRRTGQTRSRLGQGRLFSVGTTLVGEVAHPDKHLALLETGGVQHKEGLMLRIPTRNAQTAAGVDRYMGMSIRDIPDTRLVRTPHGLWAVRETGGKRSRHTEFLYLLVNSRRVPKYATAESARAMAQPKIFGAFGLMVRQAVNNG